MNEKKPNKLYEFRIKYNSGAGHAAQDSYHYYNAETSSQALSFHNAMIKKNKLKMQTLSVEKFNPYANVWESENLISETR